LNQYLNIMRKIKRTSNHNPSGHIEDCTMENHVKKKEKTKKKSKSYILMDKCPSTQTLVQKRATVLENFGLRRMY
jgi:hypothetical protein